MKIHYLSCHSILEYDEVKLLTELGYEVYSNGVYRDPKGSYTLPRPGIPNAPFSQEFFDLTALHPKTALPKELIEPFDVILSMDRPEILFHNWDNIKHKRVIWRSIGQSVSATEHMLSRMRKEGLEIIRYSPKEKNIPGYIGHDAIIRFYKDPEEFKDWNGRDIRPVNFTQTLKGRGPFCHFDEIMAALSGFHGAKVYGSGNADIGSFNGGEIPYEKMKEVLRNARVFVYGGTWPASYTLSFIEALMTGIPVIAVTKQIAHLKNHEQIDFYEVDEIIKHGENGLLASDIPTLRMWVEKVLADDVLAKKLGDAGRQTAIELFGKENIGKQWKEFLG